MATEEQILHEMTRPRKKPGKPKKYGTPEEVKEAKRNYSRRARARAKCIRAGMPIVAECATQRKVLKTKEERLEARRENQRKYYYAHPEQMTLKYLADYKKKKD